VLVIGVGNRFRRDDAAGLEVAHRLRETAPEGVSVAEIEGDGMSLLEAWRGADAVLIVDAVRSGLPAGTLHRLDAADGPISPDLFHASTHAVNVADAVELARALGELPPRLIVIGIEAAELAAGTGLSQPVEHAVERAVDAVLREIERLGEPSRA
jgi:hydrogenase maturation protease